MSKDDYFVVMYQLLKLLYDQLKVGKTINDSEFDALFIELNETYWHYIVLNMADAGYITGISQVRAIGGDTIRIHNVMITPKGIEYLFSNNMMERVKNTLKDIKGIIPGM